MALHPVKYGSLHGDEKSRADELIKSLTDAIMAEFPRVEGYPLPAQKLADILKPLKNISDKGWREYKPMVLQTELDHNFARIAVEYWLRSPQILARILDEKADKPNYLEYEGSCRIVHYQLARNSIFDSRRSFQLLPEDILDFKKDLKFPSFPEKFNYIDPLDGVEPKTSNFGTDGYKIHTDLTNWGPGAEDMGFYNEINMPIETDPKSTNIPEGRTPDYYQKRLEKESSEPGQGGGPQIGGSSGGFKWEPGKTGSSE